MADFVLRVGSRSAQGVRPNNEDRLVVDMDQRLFVVADGMGGQERGEIASGMAVDIIPRVVHERLVEELHRAAELSVGGECAAEVKADARPLLRGAGELPGPPQMRVEVLASTGGGLLEAELVQHRCNLIGWWRLLEGAA